MKTQKVLKALDQYFDTTGAEVEETSIEIYLGCGISLLLRWDCEYISGAPPVLNYTNNRHVKCQAIIYNGDWDEPGFDWFLHSSLSRKEKNIEELTSLAVNAYNRFTSNLLKKRKKLSDLEQPLDL